MPSTAESSVGLHSSTCFLSILIHWVLLDLGFAWRRQHPVVIPRSSEVSELAGNFLCAVWEWGLPGGTSVPPPSNDVTSNNPLCYSHLLVLPCSDGWMPMSCHTILGCEKNRLFRKQAVISWNNNQHGLCNLLFSGKWCHQKHAVWPHLFTHQTAKVVFSHMVPWNQVFFGQCWGLERDLFSPASQKMPLLASQLESLLSRKRLYGKTYRAGLHNADPQRKRVSRPRGIPGRLVTAPGLPSSRSDEPAHLTNWFWKWSYPEKTIWWAGEWGGVWGELRCRKAGHTHPPNSSAVSLRLWTGCEGMDFRGSWTLELKTLRGWVFVFTLLWRKVLSF